jgi:hypothetical protein
MNLPRKRIFLAGLTFIIFVSVVNTPSLASIKQGTLEFFYGNYNIRNPLFNSVYQKGSALRGMTLSAKLVSYLNFYLDIKETDKKGQLTYTKEKTELVIVPISLGIRLIFPLQLFLPYIGGGANYSFYYETNSIGTVYNLAKGYHIMAGTYFQFGQNFPLLLNVKLIYSDVQDDSRGQAIQLGGLAYGLSLGIAF